MFSNKKSTVEKIIDLSQQKENILGVFTQTKKQLEGVNSNMRDAKVVLLQEIEDLSIALKGADAEMESNDKIIGKIDEFLN